MAEPRSRCFCELGHAMYSAVFMAALGHLGSCDLAVKIVFAVKTSE